MGKDIIQMKKTNLILAILLITISFTGCNKKPVQKAFDNPNILIIYLDDMGIGDPQCFNPESLIPTPNIDRLAVEGMKFTDAHTAAPVCGPSRYGILTGRYPWRRGISGFGNGAKFRDVFIEEGRLTLASMLKMKGYNTAQVGKWGLRHNYSDAVKPGMKPGTKDAYDFPNKKLLGSQLFGFDYSWTLTYLFPVPGIDTLPGVDKISDAKLIFENSLPVDTSLQLADAYEWLPESAENVLDYMRTYAGAQENSKFNIDRDKPFFIYWDPISPHTPYMANQNFQDKSKAGIYGDYVFETDYYIGQILNILDSLELTNNTLVIFASDNGPDKYSYNRVKEYGHYGMGQWRGIKTDCWEGGNRTPLIVRWPGVVIPNSVDSSIFSLTDIMATLAEIVGEELPEDAGEDSFSFLSLLTNNSAYYERAPVMYCNTKKKLAIREGDWVFIDAATGGSAPEPEWFKKERGVIEHSEDVELFNLREDPQQLKNLAATYPEKVKEMKTILDAATQNDRTR